MPSLALFNDMACIDLFCAGLHFFVLHTIGTHQQKACINSVSHSVNKIAILAIMNVLVIVIVIVITRVSNTYDYYYYPHHNYLTREPTLFFYVFIYYRDKGQFLHSIVTLKP